jgi:hypothetical protein
MASNGKDAAVACLESAWQDGASSYRLFFQRVDGNGRPLAAAVQLAPSSGRIGSPALATDGTNYLVCWQDQQDLTCASLRGDTATAVIHLQGMSPDVAYRAGTWVVSYREQGPNGQRGTQVHLQAFGADFQPSAAASPTFPFADSFDLAAPVVATASGFALLAGEKTAQIYLLDPTLAAVGSPLDLGLPVWAYASLAASGTDLAASVAIAYGNYTFRIKDQQVLSKIALGEGGKAGVGIAMVPSGSTFSATWRTDVSTGPVYYRHDIDADPSTDLEWTPAQGGGSARMVRVGATHLIAWGTGFTEGGIQFASVADVAAP